MQEYRHLKQVVRKYQTVLKSSLPKLFRVKKRAKVYFYLHCEEPIYHRMNCEAFHGTGNFRSIRENPQWSKKGVEIVVSRAMITRIENTEMSIKPR
jgi:hypothetical protein